jgi:methionyl-tRNA formyltransferase
MTIKNKIALYAMTAKGVAVFRKILLEFGSESLAFVVTAKDKGIANDGVEEIQRLASVSGVPIFLRNEVPAELPYAIPLAVSWRWLIPGNVFSNVVVFHDSLLPKYRGFAPLVSALVNGETKIGVTALIAGDDYDTGPILAQDAFYAHYPITIQEAINQIIPCYENLAVEVGRMILSGLFNPLSQDESEATYSLWRDERDYQINWEWDAAQIRRFVDATGYPYKGASTLMEDRKVRVLLCEEQEDVVIENREPGKVIFSRDGEPIVVCGRGLLKLKRVVYDDSRDDVLPLEKFRTRFGNSR